MNNIRITSFTAAEIAERWAVHPTSVLRIMKRFGLAGAKFGPAKQAARRFSLEELRRAETLAGMGNTPSLGNDEEGRDA